MRYLLLCLIALAAPLASAQSDWQGVDRVVVVADVHGDYDNYIKVLRQAEIIDRRGRWDAAKTHLVQLGDVPDRGPDSDKIIRHLMKLEEQAEKAGGKVHALIGNHEVMNITGDLRYVHPGEYEALTTRNSKRLQENYFERVSDYIEEQKGADAVDEAFREQWFKDHPRGYVEHRQHWHPEGEFGAWVARHNTVIRINRSLFVHGGIGPDYVGWSMQDINNAVREELRSLEPSDRRVVQDEQGPLWYRGLTMGEESEETEAHVAALLERFDVDRIVMGHTPGFGTVVPRYEGRVLAADSGIGDYYGGNLASVLIEGGQAFTLQRGTPVPIPDTHEGLLDYYRAIDEIQPDINNLKVLIERLEAAGATGVERETVGESDGSAMLNDLRDLRWEHRILVIHEPEVSDPLEDLLRENREAFDERRLAWFIVSHGVLQSSLDRRVGSDLLENIRSQLDPDAGDVFLIGLDGGVKVRDKQLDLDALYAAVDAMPMRRAEARR